MKPNIFKYATSELSQDAFFCWLLEWSNKKYNDEKLNGISLNFINYICQNTNKDRINSVESIKIVKQEKNIDFYAIINDSLIILFEDKTGTSTHDNQLERYKKYIENYNNYRHSYVYIKSDIIFSNEIEEVRKEGYLIIDLYKLAELLDNISINEIYDEYIEYLHDKKNKYISYLTEEVKNWKSENWFGFIHKLNCKLEDSKFGKHYKGDDTWWLVLSIKYDKEQDNEVRLEINNKDCVIKTTFSENEVSGYKLQYKDILKKDIQKIFEGYNINYTASTGKKNMTVAYIKDKDYIILFEDGKINFDKTLDRLRVIIDRFNKYYDNL